MWREFALINVVGLASATPMADTRVIVLKVRVTEIAALNLCFTRFTIW